MPKPKPKPKTARVRKAKPAPSHVTPKKRGLDWQGRFLEIFGMSLNVSLAAQGAGIKRMTAYRERAKDADFAAAWAEAKAAAIERLEASAYERARKASDLLLIFLLKAHKPEVYRESFDQHHKGQVEIIVRREQRTGTTKTD